MEEGARRQGYITYLSDRKYPASSDEEITVTTTEDHVLQAFLESESQDLGQLRDKSGVSDPQKILKKLAEKYGRVFAPAITLPGGRSSGGYRVKVRGAQQLPR